MCKKLQEVREENEEELVVPQVCPELEVEAMDLVEVVEGVDSLPLVQEF